MAIKEQQRVTRTESNASCLCSVLSHPLRGAACKGNAGTRYLGSRRPQRMLRADCQQNCPVTAHVSGNLRSTTNEAHRGATRVTVAVALPFLRVPERNPDLSVSQSPPRRDPHKPLDRMSKEVGAGPRACGDQGPKSFSISLVRNGSSERALDRRLMGMIACLGNMFLGAR